MMRSEWLDRCFGKGAEMSMSPDVVASDSVNTITIKLTLGAGGLGASDSVGLLCGSNIDRWQFQYTSHMWGQLTPWQTMDPTAPNYLTVTCSRKGAEVNVAIGESGGLKPFQNQPDHIIRCLKLRYRYVLELSANKKLQKGDTITIIWGDTTWKSPGVGSPGVAMDYYFLPVRYSRLPRYDRDLPSRQGKYGQLPSIRVKGKETVRFHITAQPLVQKGEKVDVHVVAVDEYGNLAEDFVGKAKVSGSGKAAKNLLFRARDKGCVTLKDVQFSNIGWQSVSVASGGVVGESNSILVSEGKPNVRLYFGAMHGHTLDCDGLLTAKEHYDYARNVSRLDFASCATHAEYFNCKDAWDAYLKAATKANASGKFATFYGYEWAGYGHINGYFLKEDEAVNIYGKCILRGKHPADDPEFRIACNGERRFIRKLGALKQPAMAISHFHARYDDDLDDNVLRLHEVYSGHQQNPLDEKYQSILEQGYRIGAVGGSDTHRLQLGHLSADPESLWPQPLEIAGHSGTISMKKKCGIQGTFAPKLTRQTLWDAMHERFTYGTTGARIVALFDIDGVPMGGEIRLAKGQKAKLNVNVGGTNKLDSITIVKYDGKRWSEPYVKKNIKGRTSTFTWADKAATSDCLYYVRVRQVDNERAWTSPVWVVVE
jgi:Protein of unknown function (DUF3604)